MQKLNRKILVAGHSRWLAWTKLGFLAALWMMMFISVAYADDCLRDVTRAED